MSSVHFSFLLLSTETTVISWACYIVLLYLALFLKLFPILVTALPSNYWIEDSSSSVTNSISTPHSVKFDDGSFVRIILASDLEGHYACHCSFFCNPTCDGFLFSIFSLYYVDGNWWCRKITNELHDPHTLEIVTCKKK